MNLLRPLAAALAALCVLPLVQAQAEAPKPGQRVRLHFPSHIPQPTGMEQTYAATCKDVAYRLVVTPGSKAVVLKDSNQKEVDLSSTPLAAQLLDRDIISKVEFNCPAQALNIFLKGFITEDGVMPKAYKMVMSVTFDGKFRADHGVEPVPLDEFGTPREFKEKGKPFDK